MSNIEYAVKEAVASSKIEGYEIDQESIRLCMLVAEGKLTRDEYIMKILEMSQKEHG